jgi:hypothetical protein
MSEAGWLPRARQDGLLEETVGEELLLYDQDTHTAHCLSPIAACVWRHCDGERDVSELAVFAGAGESLVADALYELREKDLLDAEPELIQSTIPGESRRQAIGRVARYGAAAAAGSMIVSATAATPAMASSGEEELKEKEGGIFTCVPKAKAKNCCRCKSGKACANIATDEAACKTICELAYGPNTFFEWSKEAVCT